MLIFHQSRGVSANMMAFATNSANPQEYQIFVAHTCFLLNCQHTEKSKSFHYCRHQHTSSLSEGLKKYIAVSGILPEKKFGR
jgi:hypothetical protein